MPFRDPALEQELQLGGLDLRASRRVFGDLTAYLQAPIEAIAKQYWEYRRGEDVAAQQRVAQATQEAQVLAYYATTPHYLYELSYWEASRDKQAWFQVLAKACRRYRLNRVVDVGGGVGGLTLFLRSHGVACDYLDVAGNTFDYATWRFQRHGILDIHLAKHTRYADVRELNGLPSRFAFRFIGQLKPNPLSRLLRACGWRYAVAGIRIVPRLKHGGNFLVHERERST